ncbi:hypothetical protein [Ruminococcus sp.]|uniref:hypothetical protein n=1 Tax=Ruminococcus sp. TaxID=41978 RepID=UPI0025E84A45|nr:hypothetical protein [Ruminococcus sp.]
MTGTYKIAGKIIGINSLYEDVHDYCKDYRCEGTPDFTVTITEEDIRQERLKSLRLAEREGRAPYKSPDGYMEELAVYRRIAAEMLEHDTFLFHGSCVAVDGVGYLFTAKSGTGKSTHTRLWRELLGDKAVMVNDDKPLIHVEDGSVTIYGTPYNGKHHLGSNIAVPLKAVCLLERAEQNSIAEVDASVIYPKLVQQTYRPDDPLKMAQTLALLDKMTGNVRLYRLGCNMDISAAKVSYEGMRQEGDHG